MDSVGKGVGGCGLVSSCGLACVGKSLVGAVVGKAGVSGTVVGSIAVVVVVVAVDDADVVVVVVVVLVLVEVGSALSVGSVLPSVEVLKIVDIVSVVGVCVDVVTGFVVVVVVDEGSNKDLVDAGVMSTLFMS